MYEPSDDSWSSAWFNKNLAGFIETSDLLETETGTVRRLVVVDVAPFQTLMNVVHHNQDWRVLGETAGLIPTAQVVMDLPKDEGEDLGEGTWHSFELDSQQGQPGELYRDLDVLPSVPTFVSWSGLAAPIATSLSKAFSLGMLSASSDADVAVAIGAPSGELFAVYDVGQGNANALCQADGKPLVYFDLGGGCLWHTRTYPPRRTPAVPLTFCPYPSVVLSHWDFDHWFSGKTHRSRSAARWIVPDQPFGVRTGAFAASLHARGVLMKWGGKSLSTGDVTLVRCTGVTKNDSGIALFAKVGSDSVLATGDAEFNYVPIPSTSAKPQLGLVATHHGSKRLGAPVPKPTTPATLAYSFGAPNRYGHAAPTARATYIHEGWNRSLETQYGHIAINSLPPGLPCAGTCTLRLVQS